MKKTIKDLSVGDQFESRQELLTKEKIISFAQEYDPQPMHINEEAAKDTFFQTLVASGWHVAALTMRLMTETAPLGDTPLIGAKIDNLRFTRKVLPETTIFCKAHIAEINSIPDRSHGFVKMVIETCDADKKDVILYQEWSLFVPNE